MKSLIALFISFLFGISSLQAQWVDKSSSIFGNSILWSVQVIDSYNIWAITYYNNEVVKTSNGGITWTSLPVSDPTFSGFALESIAATDANTAWITATNTSGAQPYQARIYKTTDGGLTWQHQNSAYAVTGDGHWPSANHFFDANNGVNIGETYIPVPGTQMRNAVPEVLTTNNGGFTWNAVSLANLPANSQPLYFRSFAVVNNTIWYIGTDAKVYKSSDKGLTWTVKDPGFGQSVGVIMVTIAFSDINNGLAASGTTLKRTTDGGATWTTVNATGPWSAYEITAVPGASGTYVSGGRYINNAGSSVTYDSGNTWHILETTNQHFDIQFISPKIGWSGGVGKMYLFTGNALGTTKAKDPSNSFYIYPNPGQGIYHIQPSGSAPFTLEVYDLVGNKVQQQKSNSLSKNTIDLSNQKKGVYLLHIVTDEQRIIEKIVLQ